MTLDPHLIDGCPPVLLRPSVVTGRLNQNGLAPGERATATSGPVHEDSEGERGQPSPRSFTCDGGARAVTWNRENKVVFGFFHRPARR